jgi:hypothetical protein
MKNYILLIFIALTRYTNAQDNCVANPPLPALSEKAKVELVAKQALAKANYEAHATADNLIWYGRRTAYLGHYNDAIGLFTEGSKNSQTMLVFIAIGDIVIFPSVVWIKRLQILNKLPC